MSKRKLSLFISMSLDGFIATKDNGLDWLSVVEKEGEDYGYGNFTKEVDTYIIGGKTYEVVLNLTGGVFPQAEQYKCYVITRQSRENENGVTFFNGKIEELVHQLKQEKGDKIYCDGGGQIVKLLMEKDLIDEYIISIIPVVLGDGIPLFLGGTPQIKLKAMPIKQFDSGLVQLHYLRDSKE